MRLALAGITSFPALLAKAAPLVYSLFIPSGSDKLVDANGDTFKVRDN